MNPPEMQGMADRGLLGCCMFFRVLVVLVMVGFLTIVGQSPGQEASSSTQPAGESASVVPKELLSIPRVTPNMTYAQLFEVAVQAKQAGQLVDAHKILRVISDAQRENLDVLKELAEVHELRAAVAKESSDTAKETEYIDGAVMVYLYAANLAYAGGKYYDAERMYNRVLMLRPANSRAKLGLARVYATTDRPFNAVESYNDYLKTDDGKKDSKARLELGRVYRSLKSAKHQALSTLHEAAKINPEDPEILIELGWAYFDTNSMTEALEAVLKAIGRAPYNPAYRNVLAQFLLNNKKPQEAGPRALEAIRLANEALKQSPDNLDLLRSLGGYYGTYISALNMILSADADNTSVRVEMVRAIGEQAVVNCMVNLQRAMEVLLVNKKGADDLPFPLLEALAEVQFITYKLKDASVSCQRIRNPDFTSTMVTFWLKKAAETCQQILKRAPDNAVARQILDQLPLEIRGVPATSQAAAATGASP